MYGVGEGMTEESGKGLRREENGKKKGWACEA